MQKVAVHKLVKSFKQHVVLNNISFTVEAGAVLVLLGKSGSGKSTLLRCINYLEKADRGTLQLNGLTIDFRHKLKPKMVNLLRLQVGMVFQQFNLWPHKTVIQNLLEAPLSVLKQPKEEAMQQAEVLLNRVQLAHKKNVYPSQLSGGEQQRIAIARALMMKPEVIMFDEPTSSLDPEMTVEVLNVIKDLAKEGMTMLIATHEIGFARQVATHAIFLENGEIYEHGIASEVLTNPQTARFRQFLESVCC